MNKNSIILALLLCFTIACAGPQIYYGQLSKLAPGMNQQAVTELLRLPAFSTHDTVVDDKQYRFLRYKMNNGVSSSLYLIAFKEEKLMYWGYVDEFRKHPDPALGKALDNVINAILSDRSKPVKAKKLS